jgi:hypothetical protein
MFFFNEFLLFLKNVPAKKNEGSERQLVRNATLIPTEKEGSREKIASRRVSEHLEFCTGRRDSTRVAPGL